MENIKSFKGCIKNRVKFTLSLFVTFMITGGISLSGAEIIDVENGKDIKVIGIEEKEDIYDIWDEKQNFLAKLKKLRASIQKEIWKNKHEIERINDDLFTLVDKGNYFSKPTWESYQLFYTFNYKNGSATKSNYMKEWRETRIAVDDYWKRGEVYTWNRMNGGNGTVIDGKEYPTPLRLGARIIPLDVDINVEVPKVSMITFNYVAPQKLGEINIKPITISELTPNKINLNVPTLPTIVNPVQNINAININLRPENQTLPKSVEVGVTPKTNTLNVNKIDAVVANVNPPVPKTRGIDYINLYPLPFQSFYLGTPWYRYAWGTNGNGIYEGLYGASIAEGAANNDGDSEYSPLIPIFQNINLNGGEIWNGITKDGEYKQISIVENMSQAPGEWNTKRWVPNGTAPTRHISTIAMDSHVGNTPQVLENLKLHIGGAPEGYNYNNPDPNDPYIDEYPSRRYGNGTVGIFNHGDLIVRNTEIDLRNKTTAFYLKLDKGMNMVTENVKVKLGADKTSVYSLTNNYGPSHLYSLQYIGNIKNNINLDIRTNNSMVYNFKTDSRGMITAAVSEHGSNIVMSGDEDIYALVQKNMFYQNQYVIPIWRELEKVELQKRYGDNVTDENVKEYIFEKTGKTPKDFAQYIKTEEKNPVRFLGDNNVGLYVIGVLATTDLYFTFGDAPQPDWHHGKNDPDPEYINDGYGVIDGSGARKGVLNFDNGGVKIIGTDEIFDKFHIAYGSWAKSGIMFFARGTHFEIVPQNPNRIVTPDFVPQTSFSDGIDGVNTRIEDTSEGLAMTFTWGNGSGTTANTKNSQINIRQNMDMMSRRGVALSTANGEVGFFGYGDHPYLTAHNYGSVIANVRNDYLIYVDENVVARAEAITPTELTINGETIRPTVNGEEIDKPVYNNVGAMSGTKGQISFAGQLKVKGTGIHAGSRAYISAPNVNNEITVGRGQYGIIAEYGVVKFGGKIKLVDDNSVAFFAEDYEKYDDAMGKIIFLDKYKVLKYRNEIKDYVNSTIKYLDTSDKYVTHTTIEATKGLIFKEYDEKLYQADAPELDPIISSSDHYTRELWSAEEMKKFRRYSGMKNVTLNIDGDANIAILKNLKNYVYNDNSIEEEIESVTHIPVANIHIKEGATPTISIVNSDITINGDVNLDDKRSKLKNYVFLRDSITLNGSITSDSGRGIIFANNKDSHNVDETSFINKGTINISGGDENSYAINMPFGRVINENTINIENGSGIVGTNGSWITNKGTINVKNGQGILAMATRDPNHPEDFGQMTSRHIYLVNVGNEGKIVVKNGTGIYAYNNLTYDNYSEIKIQPNSEIEIENGTGIWLRSLSMNISNGTIKLTKSGIGVRASDKSNIWFYKNVVEFGDDITNAVGYYIEDATIKGYFGSQYVFTYHGDKAKPIGIYFKNTGFTINGANLVGEDFKNGILVYGEKDTYDESDKIDRDKTYNSSITVGENGVGIYLKNQNMDIYSNITLDGATGGVGVYAENGNIINKCIIRSRGENQIGIYVTGENRIAQDTSILNDTGNQNKIYIDGNNSTGIMVTKGATANIMSNSIIQVADDNTKTGQKFVSAIGGKIRINTDIEFTHDNDKGRIYAFMQDSATMTTLGNVIKVNGNNVTGDSRSIGVVMENDNTFTGKLEVKGGGVGITTKGANTINMDGSKVIKDGAVESIGIISSGGSLITNGDKIEVIDGAIGIFGKESIFTLNDNIFALTSGSIGAYMTAGGSLAGSIKIENNTPGIQQIGVYYKDSAPNAVSVKLDSDNLIGIYIAPNAVVTEAKGTTQDIASTHSNIIGTYVGGEYTKVGNISVPGADNMGAYITGNLTIHGDIDNSGSEKPTIFVDTNARFISSGVVKGKITTYLNNVTANSISLNKLDVATGGIGVVAKDSVVDFAIPTITGKSIVGIYATGSSNLQNKNGEADSYHNKIKLVGDNNIGVLVDSPDVTVSNFEITTDGGVGMLLKDGRNPKSEKAYSISKTNINAENGIGILLNEDNDIKILNYDGTITTNGGVGIRSTTTGNKITTTNSTFNVTNGTGVYIENGELTTNGLSLNFSGDNNLGIYAKNSTINLNGNLNIAGDGTGDILSSIDSNIVSNVNITGSGKNGLVGKYDGNLAANKNITNSANITLVDGNGIVAIKDKNNPPTFDVNIINAANATISVSEENSAGIYSDVAKDITNDGTIVAKNNAYGIYATNAKNIVSKKIDVVDSNGIFVNGNITKLESTNISGSGDNSIGVILQNVNNANVNLGTINIVKKNADAKNIGVTFTDTTLNNVKGNIDVTGSRAIGVVVQNSTITFAPDATISSDNIGVVANDSSNVTIQDMGKIVVNNENAIYALVQDSTLNIAGEFTVNSNQKGIILYNGKLVATTPLTITVKDKAIGIYGDKNSTVNDKITLKVESASNPTMGAYFKNLVNPILLPSFTLKGDNAVGIKLENSSGKLMKALNLGNGNHQIGVKALDGAILEIKDMNIASGKDNVGVYATDSTVKHNGNMNISEGNIGVFAKDSIYSGNANNIILGKKAIGVFVKDINSEITENITNKMVADENAIGIFAINENKNASKITVVANKIELQSSALGLYAKNIDAELTGDIKVGDKNSIGIMSTNAGNIKSTGAMNIGEKGIGIYKIKNVGNSTIDVAGNGDWKVGRGGYGIYVKYSDGVGVTNSANMILGKSAVAIALLGKNTLVNNGNIMVGETYRPIDPATGEKTKNILKFETSVGIFLGGGAVATNNAVMDIKHDSSVGVYAAGKDTHFINTGTMNIENGGIGVLVRDGANAINKGEINVKATNTQGNKTVGMAAYGVSNIINEGTINVDGKGAIGFYLGDGANATNKNKVGTHATSGGKIIDDIATHDNDKNSGVIIKNDGTLVFGNRIVQAGGILKVESDVKDNVKVILDGVKVQVEKYINVYNKKDYVFDIPNMSGDIQILPSVVETGNGLNWNIENFIKVAQEIGRPDLKVWISPLFNSKVTKKGTLVVAKKPYSDIVIGEQYDNLWTGLDNLLVDSKGVTHEGEILKKMDYYLTILAQDAVVEARTLDMKKNNYITALKHDGYSGANLEKAYLEVLSKALANNKISQKDYDTLKEYSPLDDKVIAPDMDKFTTETENMLSEFRGDMYSTIHSRIGNITNSFDTSFNEMYDSYNNTKDNNKYSVIYSCGKHEDETLAIPNYKYHIYGLLYAKEYEGMKYREKYGYTLGFAHSKFDIKDPGHSREYTYSSRIGAFKYNYLSEKYKIGLLNNMSLDYSYATARRRIDIGRIGLAHDIVNKAHYQTLNFNLKNRFDKTLYEDFSQSLNIYTGIELELARVFGFKEEGNFRLKIRGKHWNNVHANVGFNAKKDIYVKNDYIVRTKLDGKYIHSLKEQYKNVSAKLIDGRKGYYNLIAPKKMRNKVIGTVSIGLEKGNDFGISFEVQASRQNNKRHTTIKYTTRVNYNF